MNFTIDASVIVSLARASEETHAASFEFLREVRRRDGKLFCPSIVLAECSAAVARLTDNPSLAERIFSLIEALPNLSLVDVDLAIARRAAAIVASQHLKAIDALYLAVAEAQDAVLITWDMELIEHGNGVLDVITPVAWLEQHS